MSDTTPDIERRRARWPYDAELFVEHCPTVWVELVDLPWALRRFNCRNVDAATADFIDNGVCKFHIDWERGPGPTNTIEIHRYVIGDQP